MQSVSSLTDVSLQLPDFSQIFAVLTLQAGYNSAVVIFSTTCLGIASGLVGSFAVLRKRALVSDALAHCALPGLVAAFIIGALFWGGGKSILLLLSGAIFSGVLGVLCIQALVQGTRLKEDAAIGIVLSVFFGAGIVGLSYVQTMQTGAAAGLSRFIYGQTAATNSSDALAMAFLAILSLAAVLAFLKEFQLICFDSEYAASQGWPVGRIDLKIMSLVVIVTVTGLQAVGMILVIALLVIPAASARFWTDSLKTMLVLAALIGGLSGYLGSALSSLLPRLPAGAVIVIVCGSIFAFSFVFANRRGVLAAFFRHSALRFRVAEEHLLRSVYEAYEKPHYLDLGKITFSPRIPYLHILPPIFRGFILRRLDKRGYINAAALPQIELSQLGSERARILTRNHRLWEEYLLHFGSLDPAHVDYSADLAEHVLSPEIIAKLETALQAKGLQTTELLSPHPIGNGK